MSDLHRSELFDKLDPVLFQGLQSATAFCQLRGNPYVELAHWLHQLLQGPRGELHDVLAHFGIDEGAVQADVLRALDALPRGAGSVSDLSAHIDDAVERAWVYGSLKFGAQRIRVTHLLLGLLKTPALRHVLLAISRRFESVSADTLSRSLVDIVGEASSANGAAPHSADSARPADASASALQRYGQELTARARDGQLDPVSGRDAEIRQLIDILMRRRQNNPLLTGEAGVGKTAVVEGLALRIASGDVPPALKSVSLWLLDLGLLQAGAGVKGEFESRLRQVVDAVHASVRPVILFIDEIHTLVGAGGSAGTGDAANLLKPMLARGELRTIGATTWSEYKRHIEKDPALTRRFQPVQIAEPDEPRACTMLRGLATALQSHHGVLVLDEAIEAAVGLSHRYIPARQLPDKAVALLDTACARVAVSQHAPPPEVADAHARIAALHAERDIVGRECAIGLSPTARLHDIDTALAEADSVLARHQDRWHEQRTLVDRILALRRAVLAEAPENATSGAPPAAPSAERPAWRDLQEAQQQLALLQREGACVLPAVDMQAVAAVVADWTGIPVGRMQGDAAQTVLDLSKTLARRVAGQDTGLHAIAQRIQTSRARLDDPDKPVGVFLLCGPSGVGKTETALALAETLYGGEQNLVTLNMSEFQEAHTVSTLKGAPPGYVGYGEGGVLTEAIRRRPYCVVLLDEIEKAHVDVHELFFQVFDKGWMEDGEGRRIDFRNTVILLTSNVGSELMADLHADPLLAPDADAAARALRQPLLKVFPAALLGRMTVVPYRPLDAETLAQVVRMQIERVRQRMASNHAMRLEYTDAAVALIADRCTEAASGARNVGAILTATVDERTLQRVHIDAAEGDFVYDFA